MQEGGPRNPRNGTRGALVRALVPAALQTAAMAATAATCASPTYVNFSARRIFPEKAHYIVARNIMNFLFQYTSEFKVAI